jgi:hypothetical protein
MKKVILLTAMLAIVLLASAPALTQEYLSSKDANDEASLYPYCSPFGGILECAPPSSGYSSGYTKDVAGVIQYGGEASPVQDGASRVPHPGYVQWDEDCWYDPNDAYVIGPDSNIPIIDTPCGIIS